jgi:hypothetical protein
MSNHLKKVNEAKARRWYLQRIVPLLPQLKHLQWQSIKGLFWDLVLQWLAIATIFGSICYLAVMRVIPPGRIMNFAIGLQLLLPIYLVLFNCLAITRANNVFQKKLKHLVYQHALGLWGEVHWRGHDPSNREHSSSSYVSGKELKASGIFQDFNRHYVDDEFQGTYRETPFRISEIKLTDFRNRYTRFAYEEEIFKGVVATFRFNKTIKNRTIIAPRGVPIKRNSILSKKLVVSLGAAFIVLMLMGTTFERLWGGLGALMLFGIVFLLTYLILRRQARKELPDKVELEDPRFANKYQVYSSDQVEARYLITPAFMERFLQLKNAFGAKKIKCCFQGTDLLIAIPFQQNLFEVGGLFRSVENYELMKQLYQIMSAIIGLIDHFNLDKNIYKTPYHHRQKLKQKPKLK